MFWDASYNNSLSPKIEALLSQENVTLSALLDDEDILQECKSQNTKLVQFLNRPDILEELVKLITTEPPPNAVETLRFKHSNIACEILTSDLPSLNRSLVADPNILQKLYGFLEQEPPLNPLLTSFFSKTFGMLLAQKQKQDWFTYQFVCVTVLDFLKSRGNFVDTILKHIYTPVILDLLYHIVTQVEGPDLKKSVFDWFMEQKLVEKLIAVLGLEDYPEKHLNVAQFLVEYLTAGRTKRQSEKQEVDPILEVLESKETVQLLLENVLKRAEDDMGERKASSQSAIVAGINIILALFEENLLNDNIDDPALQYLQNTEKEHHQVLIASLIEVVKNYIEKFHSLLLIEPAPLVDPKIYEVSKEEKTDPEGEKPVEKPSTDAKTTTEETTPEPSSVGDAGADESASKSNVVSTAKRNNFSRKSAFGNTRLQICCLFTVLLETENRDIITAICASNFFKTLLNLFKQYCWNNFLHNQVKKCLTYAIGAYDEEKDEGGNTQLAISSLQRHLIEECKLAPHLVQCWQQNETEEVEKNGHRLGYMGHLIAVFETLVTNYKMSDKLRALVDASLADTDELELWERLIRETDGDLEVELTNQKKYLADLNPFKEEMKPQDFFIQNELSFQDLEGNMSSTISENLDNFISKYISSDLSSQFFSTLKNWSSEGLDDILDELEDLNDKPWSTKFEEDQPGSSSAAQLNFNNPWDTDDIVNQTGSKSDTNSTGDSGWANFSSANFADFDSHFNSFTIDTFNMDNVGTESNNTTFDKFENDSDDFGKDSSGSLDKTEDDTDLAHTDFVVYSDSHAKNEPENAMSENSSEIAMKTSPSEVNSNEQQTLNLESKKINSNQINSNVNESLEYKSGEGVVEEQEKIASSKMSETVEIETAGAATTTTEINASKKQEPATGLGSSTSVPPESGS